MDLETYQYLVRNPAIFAAIEQAGGDSLRIQKELRRQFPDAAVRLALTLAELRQKAAARRFPHPDRLWFDRIRLEQATAWPIARHKAARFSGELHDLCCGAGFDAIALAQRGHVLAVDADPLACWFTRQNAEELGVTGSIDIACRRVEELSNRDALLHIDPDRRRGTSRRAVRVEDYVPSLQTLRELMGAYPGGAVKLSPAANFGGKFDDVEIELVSLDGECKEATIWFGTLAGSVPWRATALPTGETIAGDPLAAEPRLAPLGDYLLDPDPALVRAGLIDLFCEQIGIARLDAAEEYLTADRFVETPFATPFRALAELPNNEKILKRHLREMRAGTLEIKARRVPTPVERWQKTLPRTGDQPLVVFVCRIAGKTRIVLAERL